MRPDESMSELERLLAEVEQQPFDGWDFSWLSVAEPGRQGRLPFGAGAFHLVNSRPESYLAREIARILTTGGHFLTQQVGHPWSDDVFSLLGYAAARASPSCTTGF